MKEGSGERRAPGDRIAGKYLLLRLLEVGGMGSVWVAHHLALDVQVAIKFIREDVGSPTAAQRLVREARAAASLDHPAIVHVSDVGRTTDGDTYLVMELLDGEDLSTVLGRERRLPPETAIRVLLPVLGALSAMHQRGIVHRDIKPENVFLACDDSGRWQPKLIDFGLARAPDRNARLTQRGYMVGTPDYMSPERMEGEDAGSQDDLWSLSVLLYEAITGKLPFSAVTDDGFVAVLRACAPRPTTEHGAGDADLWAILSRGLSRRDRRWSSAREMGQALGAWLWKRGVLDDVTGVSLRPSWVSDDAVRRMASSSRGSVVATARFDIPFRTRGATPQPPGLSAAAATPPAEEDPLSPTLAPTVEAPVPTQPPLAAPDPEDAFPAGVPRASTRRPIAVALAFLAVVMIAAGIVRWAPSSAGPATSRPQASASAAASPGDAAPPPPATTSASAPAPPTSSAGPVPPPPRPRGWKRDGGRSDDLKDPFR